MRVRPENEEQDPVTTQRLQETIIRLKELGQIQTIASLAEHVTFLASCLQEVLPSLGSSDLATEIYWRVRAEAISHGITDEVWLHVSRELQPVYKAC